ncbi:MAG: MBOAT family O-acyltransferase [Bacteriovoracaceae bacterium]
MSFINPLFIYFFIVFVIGSLVLRGNIRLWFYVGMSLFFYAYPYPIHVILLLVASIIDYKVADVLGKERDARKRKIILTFSLVSNLAMLGTFKYADFFIHNINFLSKYFGLSYQIPTLNLVLPIGISFYTFLTLSYTIDVYREKCERAKSFLEFLTFITFFPHLVAGPIVRAEEFIKQIADHIPFQKENTIRGIELVLLGFFKKVIVADHFAQYVEPIFSAPSTYSALGLWLGALFFAIQIYGDFSGYTDIARGLARIFGFNFPINFSWPYMSKSIAEFWRRWHMSLSFWFRDYLYIPLGGNRCGPVRRIFNLVVVWALCGFWHGASANFIFWGLFHGFFVSISQLGDNKVIKSIPGPVKIIVTFIITLFGWVIFRTKTLEDTFGMWKGMLSFSLNDPKLLFPTITQDSLIFLVLLIIVHIFTYSTQYDFDTKSKLLKTPLWLRAPSVALIIMLIIFFASKEQPFIYFAF